MRITVIEQKFIAEVADVLYFPIESLCSVLCMEKKVTL